MIAVIQVQVLDENGKQNSMLCLYFTLRPSLSADAVSRIVADGVTYYAPRDEHADLKCQSLRAIPAHRIYSVESFLVPKGEAERANANVDGWLHLP